MPALDFPASPVSGQLFSSGSITWQYNGTRWIIAGTSGESAPNGFFAKSTQGTHASGVWAQIGTWAFVTNTGLWTIYSGIEFNVPSEGFYAITYGFHSDAVNNDSMILSIEGANESGWLQESNQKRMSSTRVVYHGAGSRIAPYFYNRGAAITGYFVMSAHKI